MTTTTRTFTAPLTAERETWRARRAEVAEANTDLTEHKRLIVCPPFGYGLDLLNLSVEDEYGRPEGNITVDPAELIAALRVSHPELF